MSSKKTVRGTGNKANFYVKEATSSTTRSTKGPKDETAKIYNLHSNDQKEAGDFKVKAHKEYNKHGKLQTNRYVEYTIHGKHRKWEEFMSIEDFKKYNPNVRVKGL